jgi:hypothetical protein
LSGAPLIVTTKVAAVADGDSIRLRVDHMVVFDKLTGIAIT